MINMKYLLAGFSCAALLALAPASVGIMDVPQVHAADDKTTENAGFEVGINAAAQSMTVGCAKSGDTKIYVSFPTVKEGKVKDGKWASYDVGEDGVTIDLSSKKVDKEFYVQVKGNVTTAAKVYHFKAAPAKLKAVVDNASGTVKLQSDKKDLPAGTKIEYSTSNGQWEVYDGSNLSAYQENGATLRFRIAAIDNSKTEADDKNETESVTAEYVAAKNQLKDSSDKELATYDVNDVFASNEVKAKIGKRPAGPKITVNYKNHTITVAKGNYRVYQGAVKVVEVARNAAEKIEIKLDTNLKGATNVERVIVGENDTFITKAGAVEAWLGEDTTKNKARSAYTEVAFDGIKELVLKKAESDEKLTAGTNYVGILGAGETEPAKKVTAEVKALEGRKAGKYDVTIKNGTDNAYEVVVSKEEPKTDARTTAIGAGKEKAIKGQERTAHVWVRLAADTKKKIWSSVFVDMGQLAALPAPTAEVDKDNCTAKKLALTLSKDATVTTEAEDWNAKGSELTKTSAIAEKDKVTFTVTVKDGDETESTTYEAECTQVDTEKGTSEWTIKKQDTSVE